MTDSPTTLAARALGRVKSPRKATTSRANLRRAVEARRRKETAIQGQNQESSEPK